MTESSTANQRIIEEKCFIVGHRGSGKSTLLKRLSAHFEISFDLDEEIEKRSKAKIVDIFSKYGEKAFREIEEATLQKLITETQDQKSVLIALGGGYRGSIWPKEFKGLWVRRDSDIWPRFFVDKPQVGTSLEGLDFMQNFVEREERYRKWADYVWTLQEGEGLEFVDNHKLISFPSGPLVFPLIEKPDLKDSIITLHPHMHRNIEAAFKERLLWNLDYIELRTDLMNASQLERLLSLAPEKTLLSIRSPDFDFRTLTSTPALIDWDIELGSASNSQIKILSLHDFSDGISTGLKKLEEAAQAYKKKFKVNSVHLKASPLARSFDDLELLWKWYLKDPTERSILPRSPLTLELPLWQWFRLYMKKKQKLNFVREANEGVRDQPTLSQWLSVEDFKNFAAVVGNPVMHSISPVFHHDFFKKKKANYFAIPLSKEECTKEKIDFLISLGAVAFAITSPLKEALSWFDFTEPEDESSNVQTNFVFKKGLQFVRANTDRYSIPELIQKESSWIIWGSGSVGRQLYQSAQNAVLFSARESKKLNKKGELDLSTAALLWAAGDEASLPDDSMKTAKVYDLSYSHRSRGRLWAQKNGSEYFAGLKFFVTQAQNQQRLFEAYEPK